MPNQHTVGVTQLDLVLEYVRAHPQATTPEITEAVGLVNTQRAHKYLVRLYHQGLVTNEKEKGMRRHKWTAVEPENVQAETPKQDVVQRWLGCPGRDPLVAALFGPAENFQGA